MIHVYNQQLRPIINLDIFIYHSNGRGNDNIGLVAYKQIGKEKETIKHLKT